MLYLLLPASLTLNVSRPRKHRGYAHGHASMVSRPSMSSVASSSSTNLSASSSSVSLTSAQPREIPLQRSQSIASLASLGSFNSSRASTSKPNVQTGKSIAGFWSWRS